MPAIDFTGLPDDARLWVFAAAHPLKEEQKSRLLSDVDSFLERWNAHGHPVVGARALRDDRFLLMAADERATGVSGCSIDTLFRVFKQLEIATGATLLDSSLVHYRDRHGRVLSTSRGEFRELARKGEVNAETIVFDNTVATVGDMRTGKWERPAGESWHARAFGLAGSGTPAQ
jgi:hypothetical protein